MCGICGFLDLDGQLSEDDLRRMNATITRRGPDGEGIFFERGVGLAMRRLAIIDINGGWQPVYNEDKTVTVVFNGEIYNFRQLRSRLESLGHRFRTQSDSEVIAHSYEEYGDAFVEHLEGMFAIALWDSQKQRLLLARDRFGIKPLYVARIGNGIIFGSEIKTLLASGRVARDIDWNAVDQYFAYTWIPAPLSIYRDISKFPTAHVATLGRDSQYAERRYWHLPPQRPQRSSRAELEQQVESALLQAVESHMVADVPVGAFLSGGVDSSIIVAMMTRFTDKPVQAFTVGFQQAGGGFLDERVYARELAARYKLDHVEIDVQADASAILPDVISAFDEPFADDSVIPSYYVSQATVRSVKVAMTGLGGDELFGGYKRHLGLNLARYFAAIPSPLRNHVIAPLVRRLPEHARWGDSIDHLKRFTRGSTGGFGAQYQDYMTTQPWSERQSLFRPDIAARMQEARTARIVLDLFEGAQTDSVLERALRTDIGLYLPDDILALTDRLSMWHSLELRVPFLHHPFVELSANLPANAKISGMTQKSILKSVARKWIPDSIIDHRKQGFEAPMGAWLRGPLLPLLDELTRPEELERVGVFNPEVVRRLRDEHIAGVRKNSKILFSLLVFMYWAKHNHA